MFGSPACSIFFSILSPSLSAYRKGYSCEAVLLRLIKDWRKALDNKCVVGSVVMDLSKAFDLLPHNLLLAKLAAYGISTPSLNLLQTYLLHRKQRASQRLDLVCFIFLVAVTVSCCCSGVEQYRFVKNNTLINYSC